MKNPRLSQRLIYFLELIKRFLFNFYTFAGMALITISNILSEIPFVSGVLGRQSHNDAFTSQPRITPRPFTLDTAEQYMSIEGQEQMIYETTPELRTVIDRLAVMYANGIWEELDQNGEPIEKSIWVDFLENPNVFQSRNEFLFQWFVQRCVYGNVFDYQLKGPFQEQPAALWHLPPSRIVVKRSGLMFKQTDINNIIDGYELQLDSQQKQTYTPDEIIQFSMPNCDDPLLGSCPLLAIRMPISTIRAAHGFINVVMTKKGALGIWRNETKTAEGFVPTSDEDKKMVQSMLKHYGIGDKQMPFAVSEGNLRWEPSTFPVGDYKIFETFDANKTAIIDFYGASKDMFSAGSIGGKTGSTFQNKEMADRQCYQNTLIPIANDMANGYAKRWGILDKGHTLRLNYEHLPVMQKDLSREADILLKKSQAASTLLASGVSAESVAEITGLELGKIKAIQANSTAS